MGYPNAIKPRFIIQLAQKLSSSPFLWSFVFNIYLLSKDRDSGPRPPYSLKNPNLGGDRFAGLYIRQRRFTKSAIFVAKFSHLPYVLPFSNVFIWTLLGPFYHLVFTECRNSKYFGFYDHMKMATFGLEMYHLHHHHLLLQFPRLYSKSIWPTFTKLGTHLPTNILQV